MSDEPTPRRTPRAFDVPPAEPAATPTLAPPAEPRAPRALAVETATLDPETAFDDEVPALDRPMPRRRGPWAALALACLTGLVGLAFGLWVEGLIAELFALGAWAGVAGLVLVAGLALAVLVAVVREVAALLRLGRRDALRERAAAVLAARDDRAARRVADDLAAILKAKPEAARGRAAVAENRDAVMDAEDRLAHAEVALLGPLDREARALVLAAAKRVSVVTAIAPRALIDIAYVLIENVRLVRAIATTYGLRPGRLGMVRLLRDVVGHLAVTGAVSAGDALIEQAVGHGVASRVSARLGEGVLNGLLTARMGLSAVDLCRPLPHRALPRPTARDLLAELGSTSRLP